jgi:hypothetical protein
MTCYIISFDLVKKGDYEELYKSIKSYKKWAHITESTWSIVTDNTAEQIVDDLKKFMDPEDILFVIKSGEEADWFNVFCKDEWLYHNL